MKNGIALSSRNAKLKKNQILIAGKIYKYLKKLKRKTSHANLKEQHLDVIDKIKLLGAEKIDYLEYINIKTLENAKKFDKNFNIFIAFYIGGVRLIDNL